MAWTETATGHWQRPIGENEAMIKFIGDGGRKHNKDTWSISATANFRASLEPESLLQALEDGWKSLRFRHPSIATTVNDNLIEYRTPSSTELEQWANETFVIVQNDSSLSDVIAQLTPHRFATLYYLKKHDIILLNVSHWHTDGIGAFYLLDAYFRAVLESLDQDVLGLAWGDEPVRLIPSVEEALGLPFDPTPKIDRAVKRYLATLANNKGALETPYKPGDDVGPKGTQCVQLQFSKEETKKIFLESARLDISLEAAVHASVSATAYSIAIPSSRHKHHSSTLRQSIRPHLPPPYNGEAGAAGIYTAGYIVKVPSSQSWLQNAEQYEYEYSKGAEPDLLYSRRQYAVEMTAILKGMKAPPSPPPSGLDISFVPDVQHLMKPVYKNGTDSLEVCDVGLGVDVTSRHLYVFFWTFNDQLKLQLVYNEAYYEGSFVDKILPTVKQHLLNNLSHRDSR